MTTLNIKQLVAVDEAIASLTKASNIIANPLAEHAIALAWQLHNEIVQRVTIMGLIDEWLELTKDFVPWQAQSAELSHRGQHAVTRDELAEIVSRCEWIDADELHSIPPHDNQMVHWVSIALGWGDRDLAYRQPPKPDAGVYFFTAYARDFKGFSHQKQR